jgi:hypothetical protein
MPDVMRERIFLIHAAADKFNELSLSPSKASRIFANG